MIQCPRCQKWTLEFDDYFGRFRCYNPDCRWMPQSAADRLIRRTEEPEHVIPLGETSKDELGLRVQFSYDRDADSLLFEFGSVEPAYDVPAEDGGIVWKIGYESNSVVGFEILCAKKKGIEEVHVEILAAQKVGIERRLRQLRKLAADCTPRAFIQQLVVTVQAREEPPEPDPRLSSAFREGLDRFRTDQLGRTQEQPRPV